MAEPGSLRCPVHDDTGLTILDFRMERTICNAIRFEVVCPTVAPFLARFGKAGQLDSTGKKLATYITEVCGGLYVSWC